MKLAEKLLNDLHVAQKEVEKAQTNAQKINKKLNFSAPNCCVRFNSVTIKEGPVLNLYGSINELYGENLIKFHQWFNNIMGDYIIETMKEIKEGKNE